MFLKNPKSFFAIIATTKMPREKTKNRREHNLLKKQENKTKSSIFSVKNTAQKTAMGHAPPKKKPERPSGKGYISPKVCGFHDDAKQRGKS